MSCFSNNYLWRENMIFIKELVGPAIEPYGSGCGNFQCPKNQDDEGAAQSRTKNQIQSCCPGK